MLVFTPHFLNIVVDVKASGPPYVLNIVVDVKASGPPYVLNIVVDVKASGPPHVLNIVVDVKASGPPHVLGQWLTVSKGMLHAKYFCSNKASFCVSSILWRS